MHHSPWDSGESPTYIQALTDKHAQRKQATEHFFPRSKKQKYDMENRGS